MCFNARFRGLLAASLLTAALMGLMISLFSLPVFFLWPVLLGILAAATVCMMDGARLSWLPAAAWMAACLLTVLVLLGTVTNGLAQLLDDVLKAWQQLHARNYTNFLAQEDGNTGLTVVLCMLGVLCGLWSIRYVWQPGGLRFWPLAVILAAAAVLFAPMVSVWWLLLAALTVLLLYAVHFGGGKRYSPAALRTWGRLAAVLLVCVTVLGGWNQDAARPAVVDTAANWAAEQADTLRYMGDTMLQKTYSTGPLPVKRHRNKGQRTQYYIADTHPAIISKHDFEKVQTLLGTKKAQYTKAQQKSRFPFAKKLCCRECGSTLRRKDQKGSAYWCCMTHDADKNECALPPIPETQIQQAFLRLYYNLKHQGSRILPNLITNLQSIRERKFLWSVDVIELNKQIAELTSQNQLLATLRESGCVDSDIFISKSNKLTEQLRAAKQAKSRLLNQDGDDAIPCTQELITILKRGPETLHDFDGELFGQLIDKVIIESNTSLRFRLKNGLELRESIERTVR